VLRWGDGSGRDEGDWSWGGCGENGGALSAFYRTVGRRNAGDRGEGGGGGRTSMTPVTGDENRKGEVMGWCHFHRGRRQGGSMWQEADGIATSDAEAVESEGSRG
jgi:hypothetical protein